MKKPKFSILADFKKKYFQNLAKSAVFAQIQKFWLKMFENESKYIPKTFLHKMSDFFFEIFMFLGSFLLPQKKKKKRLTDRPYLAGPSAS